MKTTKKVITFNGKDINTLTKEQLIKSIEDAVSAGVSGFRNEVSETTIKIVPKKEIIYFRESMFQSVVADFTSFGLVVGGLILNHVYLDSRWYIDLFFLFIFFVLISSRGKDKAKRFTDIKKFKDYVKEMK